MNFFTDLFTQLSARDSILVLLFLFVAFFIGFITAWWYWRKISKELEASLESANAQNAEWKLKYSDLEKDREELQFTLDNARQKSLADIELLEKQLKDKNAELEQTVKLLSVCQEKIKSAKNAVAKSGAADSARASFASALGNKVKQATAAEKDDLKRISGVGKFIEEKLNAMGIYTFEQITQFDDDLVEKVNTAIEFFPGRIARDHWVDQARELFKQKTSGQA
jgi:predicted flap endonuclease-1-like 5' DNA nuclease